jgi:porin
MYFSFSERLERLAARVTGPMSFRFILQPTAAVILGIKDGLMDAKAGTPPFVFDLPYLYQPAKDVDKGIGIFGRYGIADSASNPVMRFYSAGAGGKGIVPIRPNDTFGIGGYYINISNPSLTVLGKTLSLLGDEKGIETYYSFALTKWCILTPDIQFIDPAQKKMVNGVSVSNIGSSTVLGLRLQLIF